jgi:hypothetical protein
MRVSRGTCEVCKQPVQAIETAAYPITGWVSERKGGGANAVIGKKVLPDRVAHAICVKTALKRSPEQLSL